jgi:hypothetical protein
LGKYGNNAYTSPPKQIIFPPAPAFSRRPKKNGVPGRKIFPGRKQEESAMNKLLIATSIAVLAAWTGPAFVGQAHAAAANNPMCTLAGGQKDLVGWSQFYGCFGSRPMMHPAMMQPVMARSGHGAPDSDFCKMAAGEKDMVGWSQFYRCWHH